MQVEIILQIFKEEIHNVQRIDIAKKVRQGPCFVDYVVYHPSISHSINLCPVLIYCKQLHLLDPWTGLVIAKGSSTLIQGPKTFQT